MSSMLFKLYKFFPEPRLRKIIIKIFLKREGGQMYSATLRKIYKEIHGIEIGYGSYGGCFSTINIPSGTVFGNYCSVAPDIRVFRANHPKNTFTTHPLLYNPVAGYVKRDMLERPTLTVGHDVWIGELAVILPGVKNIGNGAIIGAGSIVTKDVESYSVVAGNPAKKIGQRFNEKIIAALKVSQWWTMEKEKLISHIDELNGMVKRTE